MDDELERMWKAQIESVQAASGIILLFLFNLVQVIRKISKSTTTFR